MIADFIAEVMTYPALISAIGAKVYPLDFPQGCKLPAIAVRQVSGAPLMADDGNTGLYNARLQVDCKADSYAEAKDLADEFKTVGEAMNAAQAGFLLVELEAELDNRDAVADGSEYPYRVTLVFNLWKGD